MQRPFSSRNKARAQNADAKLHLFCEPTKFFHNFRLKFDEKRQNDEQCHSCLPEIYEIGSNM